MNGEEKGRKVWDARQREVIALTEGEHLVLAPPGCGKTDILAERIQHALQRRTPAEEMICLTFTNRASREMRKRIQKNIPGCPAIFVGNLHKFCSEFLFHNQHIKANATILDEFDLQDILKEYMPDSFLDQALGVENVYMDNYTLKWGVVHSRFLLEEQWPVPQNNSRSIKEKRLETLYNDCRLQVANLLTHVYQLCHAHPEETLLHPAFHDWMSCEKLLDLFTHPERLDDRDLVHRIILGAVLLDQYKRERDLLTFDDLILQTYTLYRDGSPKRYAWIQVDEVQDLNPLQLALVDAMKGEQSCVVYLGDEQQAIFSFMGAKLETLEVLKRKCQDTMRLERNFRSPKFLVDLLNQYARDILHTPADLLPAANNDCAPEAADKMIFGFFQHEVNGIVKRALPYYMQLSQHDEETRPNGGPYKTAVIVPTNALADRICEELIASNIPHFKISGSDIFSHDLVKTVIAHFSVLGNDVNYMAWARIIWQLMPDCCFTEARDVMKRMLDCAVLPDDLILHPDRPYIQRFLDAYLNDTLVVFDTETTGLDVFHDDIVQIAAIKVKRGKVKGKLDLVLHTDREIPAMLGDIPNPLVEMYASTPHLGRREGLKKFLSFCKGCKLVAHNANYDYHILDFNLRRDCGWSGLQETHGEWFDTLKAARLLFPKMRHYKLKYLGEALGLEGANTHLADDDTFLTVNLLHRLAEECQQRREELEAFLRDYRDFLSEFAGMYGDLYRHSLSLLYRERPDTGEFAHILPAEMAYVFATLQGRMEDSDVDKVRRILRFIDEDVIEEGGGGPLLDELTLYLPSLSTFKEADLCESGSLKEKVFVSTIHKAKGLEFQNVIVTSAIDGFYPFFTSVTREKKLEDARKLYVALSRSKKRLCITFEHFSEWGSGQRLSPFLSTIAPHFRQYDERKGK